MNRMDRLFGMVVLLQARRRIRAEDLATEFGVSRRTIYRDILALNEAGIPIVSLPGEGYRLVEGFFLPPLRFTVAEASALVLGVRLLKEQAAGSLVEGADQAMVKIVAALRGNTREEVDSLSGAIDFLTPRARFNLDDPRLEALQRAIRESRVLRLRYHSLTRDETTEREVEPHQLTYSDGVWYLSGYCRLRQGRREFRLSRIEALSTLAETFDRPSALPSEDPGRRINVRLRVAVRAARWVRERQHYAFRQEEAADAGAGSGVIMTYEVDTLSELVPWLRAWGAAVEVLSPLHLREAMRREAQEIADMLT